MRILSISSRIDRKWLVAILYSTVNGPAGQPRSALQVLYCSTVLRTLCYRQLTGMCKGGVTAYTLSYSAKGLAISCPSSQGMRFVTATTLPSTNVVTRKDQPTDRLLSFTFWVSFACATVGD